MRHFFSCFEQSISLVHFSHSWFILLNIQNKCHIFPHNIPCILYFIHSSRDVGKIYSGKGGGSPYDEAGSR